MEGRDSEVVFESLGLNPQLFINETLNSVDDLLNDAFNFFLQEASTLLNTQSTDKSQDLAKGVDYIRNRVQSVMDKRLQMWEKYCLHHCFAVPQGFSLPSNEELPPDVSVIQDALHGQDLDSQLNSLRDRLRAAGAECVKLNSELLELEKKSASSGRTDRLVNEALSLLEHNSAHEMFQEMTKKASQLCSKLEKLNSLKVKNGEQMWEGLTGEQCTDFSGLHLPKGLAHVKLGDLQEVLGGLKNI